MQNLPMFDGSESTIDFWKRQHGKRTIVNGIAYRLNVSVVQAIYPYKHESLSVYAVPLNKRSKVYKQVKANFRYPDDWSTDVLQSFDFECEVLTQIAQEII